MPSETTAEATPTRPAESAATPNEYEAGETAGESTVAAAGIQMQAATTLG